MLQKRPLAVRPAKALPLLPVCESGGVEDLGEAVRARVQDGVLAGRHHRRQGGEAQRRDAEVEHGQRGELHLAALDLLAQVLGRAAHHQAGDEHREDGDDEQPHDADPDAAEDHLAQGDVEHRHAAGQRRQAVVAVVDGAARGVGRDVVANSTESAMPKRTSLPSMLPPAWVGGERLVGAELGEDRVALCSLAYITATLMSRITMAAANSAQPWRWLPAKRPNV